MSWLTDLIGKGVDKIWPDKSKAREQQTALNAEELKGAPQSRNTPTSVGKTTSMKS